MVHARYINVVRRIAHVPIARQFESELNARTRQSKVNCILYDGDAGEGDADIWLFSVASARHGLQIIFIGWLLLSFFVHVQ